jgi:hypothetical protein
VCFFFGHPCYRSFFGFASLYLRWDGDLDQIDRDRAPRMTSNSFFAILSSPCPGVMAYAELAKPRGFVVRFAQPAKRIARSVAAGLHSDDFDKCMMGEP